MMKRTLLKKTQEAIDNEAQFESETTFGLSQLQTEVSMASPTPRRVDIFMVVRDQPEYVRHCIESIRQNTSSYHLYLWDNGSQEPTANYLKQVVAEAKCPQNVTLHREEENKGFLIPNNRLAEMSEVDPAEWMIFINSDCYVHEGWDRAMTSWLENNSNAAQVGYAGGYLDHTGRGVRGGLGGGVDYISGSCFCISRDTYKEFGLFDEENLQFAYCEDSDFSMRLREAGRGIYALHLPLVIHYGNKTSIPVMQEDQERRIAGFIGANHAYLQRKWAKFLPKR
jgi:GT2 family glycosyltransferase